MSQTSTRFAAWEATCESSGCRIPTTSSMCFLPERTCWVYQNSGGEDFVWAKRLQVQNLELSVEPLSSEIVQRHLVFERPVAKEVLRGGTHLLLVYRPRQIPHPLDNCGEKIEIILFVRLRLEAATHLSLPFICVTIFSVGSISVKNV